MYTQTQIEIIKRFGKKELSDYCLVEVDGIYIYHRDKSILECHYTILGHIPHFERILEVLFDNDIGVILWNMHKKSIVLEFLNEKDDLCRTREIDYDWTKEPLEQDEKVLQELLSLFPN